MDLFAEIGNGIVDIVCRIHFTARRIEIDDQRTNLLVLFRFFDLFADVFRIRNAASVRTALVHDDSSDIDHCNFLFIGRFSGNIFFGIFL